jgi:hypothetical protein
MNFKLQLRLLHPPPSESLGKTNKQTAFSLQVSFFVFKPPIYSDYSNKERRTLFFLNCIRLKKKKKNGDYISFQRKDILCHLDMFGINMSVH